MFARACAVLVSLQLTCTCIAAAEEPAALRDSVSLDGSWEIIFDHENLGPEWRWHLSEEFAKQPDRRTIRVPSCWEQYEKDYEGVAYYRRTFEVPAHWEGRTVRLHFDAVNFRAEVWVNDQAVGVHEGGFTPFEFRVDSVLEPGKQNVVTLRVLGPILLTDQRIDGTGPMETPQWRGAITGGVWQPVELIATGRTYVDDVFIEPNIDESTATFHVDLQHTGQTSTTADIEITVRPAGRSDPSAAALPETLRILPGSNQYTFKVQIPDAHYWSPDDPFLYRAEVSVSQGRTLSDRWTARFGMRWFTIENGRFCLNGKPVYLKAVFFEGLYPVGLAYPDSPAMARREIQLAKQAGFNMIRPWRKPPPPMWLELADELGMMTVGSLPVECMGFPLESARLPQWVENELRRAVLRDRNRACVVQWELFNEITRPVLKRLLQPMAVLARRLDPTRMILDESGGWAQGANIYLPGQFEPTKFNDVHHYPGPHIDAVVFTKLLLVGRKSVVEQRARGLAGPLPGRNVVPGLPTYVSELGYGSLPELQQNLEQFAEHGNPIVPPAVYHRRLAAEHRRVLREHGFDAIYPELRRFCLDQQRQHGAANKRAIEAVRCNPAVIGYCVHALTGGDWIIGAGLLDLWRNPKSHAYEATRAANQARIVVIRVLPRNVYAQRGTTLEITGVNDQQPVAGTLRLEIVDARGNVVLSKELPAHLRAGITRLLKERIDTHAFRGTCTLRATLVAKDGTPIAQNTSAFDVFAPDQLEAPGQPIAVLDPHDALKPFLNENGIAFADFDARTERRRPVFVARTLARNDFEKEQFRALIEWVAAGGTAVFLDGVGQVRVQRFSGPLETSALLPVSFRAINARGTWAPISHLAKDHPIFAGLPSNCMMGSIYENVCARAALLGLRGEMIAGAVGFDWFPEGDRMKRHYAGPGATWCGAIVAEIPHGRGRLILSQLQVCSNLGDDPVADRILYNLIQYTAAGRTDSKPHSPSPASSGFD